MHYLLAAEKWRPEKKGWKKEEENEGKKAGWTKEGRSILNRLEFLTYFLESLVVW